MAPLASIVSLVLLAASAVPSVVAGPHCAKKHHGKPWCVQLCKSHWGWKGHMMGTDRWGGVMQKVDAKEWDAMITKACGLDGSQNQNATSPVGNAAVNSTLSSSVAVSTPAAAATSSIVLNVSKPVSSAKPTTIKPVTTISSFTRSTTHATQPTTSVVKPTTSIKPTTTVKATTSAKPTTSAAAVAATSAAASSGNSDEDQYLSAHNSFRALHGAAALTWSDELAAKAQQWANGCKFQHSGGSLGPYGENLAAGTGSYSIASAIKGWTDESKDYDPSNPTFSHFTQVVWKGTKQLGCAVQSCDGIFDASYGKAQYYVCEYYPAGNVIGQFAENVQA